MWGMEMRRLLNTLYVFTDNAYLALENENVVAKSKGVEIGRVPLHTLQSIVSFSYSGASPGLMGECAKRGIALSFYSPGGRYLASVSEVVQGNVVLRRIQGRIADDEPSSVTFAKNFILAKIHNSKQVLDRGCRDHSLRVDVCRLKSASDHLLKSMQAVKACDSLDRLRGIEGDAAAVYYSVFDELILKEGFEFNGRTRRPPRDNVNAMLSLFYSVLVKDCASALSGAGLDPYVGFLHADRPGRQSLALDCMEEFRPVFVDRFVLTSINNRVVVPDDFERDETGGVCLTEKGRKTLFKAWQERKREQVRHSFLGERVPRGILPIVQAQLLGKALRGDLDGYPPYFWR